ncbi:hypothetical protein GCM10022216_24000 [Sphingobacterium kyonggiense]|uniref:Uncharacterized protein n=2 Tax=Sphingobacterium kyonggiense TaxID=714075 RepID=A0ABP7Z082_9SPHI
MQGSDLEDPPKKRRNILANGPGSIIRRSSRSQVQNGDGSSDNFLDNAYEMDIGFTPIGTVFDIKAAISGKDMSEEQLAWGWRFAGVIPFVSEFKKGFKIISTVKKIKNFWVVNDIYEARSRGGALVYFKNTSNIIVEIVGYSNKANQQAVINRLIEVNKSLKK